LAGLVVAALIVPTVAQAHTPHHKWYWAASDAEQELLDTRLRWRTDTGQEIDVITRAKCYGFGRWYGGANRDKRLFQHFRCLVKPWEGDSYWLTFHTSGRTTWFYTWLRWA
jgi:hypothetical protein